MEDIKKAEGRDLARDREDKTVDRFKTVRKPRGYVRLVKETEELRTSRSETTRADTVCPEDKYEDNVSIPLVYRYQPVFRSPKATERTRYPSESDEEPRRDKRIIRKLMEMRATTTGTRLKKAVDRQLSGLTKAKKKIEMGGGITEPLTAT